MWARGAWAFAVLATLACAIGGVLSAIALRDLGPLVPEDESGQLLILPFIAPIYAWVGALILARRPNRIGWLFCLTALGLSMYVLGVGYASWGSIVASEPAPGLRFAAWFGTWSAVTALAVLPIVLVLYPTGLPPSRRWRPIVWAGWLLVIGYTLSAALQPRFAGPWTVVTGQLSSPIPITVRDLGVIGRILAVPQGVLLGVVIVAALIAPIWRYRGAGREERRQLRWMTAIPAVILSFFAGGAALSTLARNSTVDDAFGTIFWGVLPFLVLAAIPIAAGVAIVRHGLFDVEVVIRKAVVFALVVTALTSVLLLVTVALPLLVVGLGPEDALLDPLPLLLGLLLGLLVVPLSRIARRVADRLVYRGRATPYQVLAEFSQRMGDTYSVDDVLPRMARLLAAGTGAQETRVWVRSADGRLRADASWPDEAAPLAPIACRGRDLPTLKDWSAVFPVLHQGETLGALTLRMRASDPMNDTKERLAQEVAAQAGLVLRNVALIEDLRESRRRIVAAQDERARKLERDIHDGAQQQLVALTVKLRLAEQLTAREPRKAGELLGQLRSEATDALENLRDLARGIYPPLLADQGLEAALTAQARKAAIPVAVRAEGVGRFDPAVEAAVYFSCLEALQNVAKYALTSAATVTLADGDGSLSFTVQDDGDGFDPATVARGSGLQGIADRVAALGGSVSIDSGPGRGVTIRGSIPAAARP